MCKMGWLLPKGCLMHYISFTYKGLELSNLEENKHLCHSNSIIMVIIHWMIVVVWLIILLMKIYLQGEGKLHFGDFFKLRKVKKFMMMNNISIKLCKKMVIEVMFMNLNIFNLVVYVYKCFNFCKFKYLSNN